MTTIYCLASPFSGVVSNRGVALPRRFDFVPLGQVVAPRYAAPRVQLGQPSPCSRCSNICRCSPPRRRLRSALPAPAGRARVRRLVRPPLFAVVARLHGFRKELIAVARERLDIDNSRLDRPEAPSSGLIAQIGIPVRGADENALPRLDDFLAAVTRPVSFSRAGDEGFEQSSLGSAHGVHLGNFYQPLEVSGQRARPPYLLLSLASIAHS
jgi:hypothetical protein